MKEKLLRIKRGEAQLFPTLIDAYLNKVYNVLLKELGPAKAIEATQQVFMQMYNDILRKYRWQDPEQFLHNSLKRSLKKKGIAAVDLETVAEVQDAPPIIIRSLLMQLSSHHKKSAFRKTGVISAVFVILILSLSYFAGQVAMEKERGMIYIDNYETHEIFHDTFSTYNLQGETRMIRSMTPLINNGMLVDYVISDTQLECEVWKSGHVLYSFKVPAEWNFITGSLADEYYLFYDLEQIYQVNDKGKVLKTIPIPETLKDIQVQLEGSVVLVASQDTTYIIASDTLETVGVQPGTILAMHSLDKYIYRNGEDTNLPQADDERTLMSLTYTPSGDLVVVYRDASIVCYQDDTVLWQRETKGVDTTPQKRYTPYNDSTADVTVYNSYAFATPAVAAVVNSTNLGVYMQVINLEDGELLVDENATMRTGNITPLPVLSRDQRFLLNAVQREEEKLVVRYLGFTDLITSPYRNTTLSSSKTVKAWALDDNQGSYYVYILDTSNRFSVTEVLVEE